MQIIVHIPSPMNQVQAGSQQYAYVAFRLGLILSRPNLQIVTLNKNNALATHVLDAAIDVTNDPTLEQRIKANTLQPLHVQCGHLQPQRPPSRLLLLKVGMGRIFPLEREVLQNPPPDYDTIQIIEREEELSSFSHEFILRSKQQYQWVYEVQFVCLPQTDSFRPFQRDQLCEQCSSKPADYHCVEEGQKFCAECYTATHRSARKKTHIKEALSPFNSFQVCFAHSAPLSHYCFNCKALKCPSCPPQPNHERMSVREIGVLFQEKETQLQKEGKTKLNGRIREIEGKIHAISKHYELRVREVQKSFNEALRQLEAETSFELNKAAVIHCELKRKYDELIWIGKYVEHVGSQCDALSNIKLREGLSLFVDGITAQEYFQNIDKRTQQIKIFK